MGADIAHQLNCDFGLGVAFFFFFSVISWELKTLN